MSKEIIICICVILFIITIDAFTQNFSKQTIDRITDELTSYKEEIINQIKNENEEKDNKNKKENNSESKENYENENKDESKNDEVSITNRINDITDEFYEKYELLAFYIEHDELEKVKTELVNIKANVETREYEQANADIGRAIFLLDHIKQKMSLQVKNIF